MAAKATTTTAAAAPSTKNTRKEDESDISELSADWKRKQTEKIPATDVAKKVHSFEEELTPEDYQKPINKHKTKFTVGIYSYNGSHYILAEDAYRLSGKEDRFCQKEPYAPGDKNALCDTRALFVETCTQKDVRLFVSLAFAAVYIEMSSELRSNQKKKFKKNMLLCMYQLEGRVAPTALLTPSPSLKKSKSPSSSPGNRNNTCRNASQTAVRASTTTSSSEKIKSKSNPKSKTKQTATSTAVNEKTNGSTSHDVKAKSRAEITPTVERDPFVDEFLGEPDYKPVLRAPKKRKHPNDDQAEPQLQTKD